MKKRNTRTSGLKARRNGSTAKQKIVNEKEIIPTVRHNVNRNHVRNKEDDSTLPFQCLKKSQRIQTREMIQTNNKNVGVLTKMIAPVVLVETKPDKRSSRLSL